VSNGRPWSNQIAAKWPTSYQTAIAEPDLQRPVQGPSADISVSIRDEIEELIRRFSEANTGIERLFLG
jgi:hypothetical protein